MAPADRITVALAGAFDTKGEDFLFVKTLIEECGVATLTLDFGVLDEPAFSPDIRREEVAAAGGGDLSVLQSGRHKGEAMRVMSAGLAVIVRRLFDEGKIHGILSMGGGGGTAIATAAMRTLPLGFPKVVVSTVGSSDMSSFVGARDIVVFPSVVDVAGVNRVSRPIYTNAAAAIAGMAQAGVAGSDEDKPVITASMFGNTTPCVEQARAPLEAAGYEVLVFHATGAGGRTMRGLIDDGLVAGVLDVTTTELADEVCGGIFSAGADRVRLGAERDTPVVLAPGCVDMCNFWARSTVPEKYQRRNLYEWNPNVTLLRTNAEENARIGAMIAETANLCRGPAAVLLPLKGVSMLDAPGGPFWDPEADAACFDAIRRQLRPGIPVVEIDANINDPEFARRAAAELLAMLARRR